MRYTPVPSVHPPPAPLLPSSCPVVPLLCLPPLTSSCGHPLPHQFVQEGFTRPAGRPGGRTAPTYVKAHSWQVVLASPTPPALKGDRIVSLITSSNRHQSFRDVTASLFKVDMSVPGFRKGKAWRKPCPSPVGTGSADVCDTCGSEHCIPPRGRMQSS